MITEVDKMAANLKTLKKDPHNIIQQAIANSDLRCRKQALER